MSAHDDSAVPRLSSMRRSDGWRTEHLPEDYDIYIFVAPDGRRFVYALESEKADAIREYDDIPPCRLRFEETSARVRKARKKNATVLTGAELLEVKKERGRKIREAREKAKQKPTEAVE